MFPPTHLFRFCSLRFIGILFIALALFSLSGGHWALLQSVAWAKMLQSYSSQGSFSSAVEKTFSGKYRCSLCKKIEQAKQQEKKNNFLCDYFKKKEGIIERLFSLPTIFPKNFNYALAPTPKSLLTAMEPPLPPPRVILLG